MIDLREVRSVTDFQRNTKEYIAKLKNAKSPIVLTVNGRAELVVHSAAGYQELLDRLDALELESAIEAGEADVKAGRTRPLNQLNSAVKHRLGRKAL